MIQYSMDHHQSTIVINQSYNERKRNQEMNNAIVVLVKNTNVVVEYNSHKIHIV